MKKRILSFVLTLAMVFSMLPTMGMTASATGDGDATATTTASFWATNRSSGWGVPYFMNTDGSELTVNEDCSGNVSTVYPKLQLTLTNTEDRTDVQTDTTCDGVGPTLKVGSTYSIAQSDAATNKYTLKHNNMQIKATGTDADEFEWVSGGDGATTNSDLDTIWLFVNTDYEEHTYTLDYPDDVYYYRGGSLQIKANNSLVVTPCFSDGTSEEVLSETFNRLKYDVNGNKITYSTGDLSVSNGDYMYEVESTSTEGNTTTIKLKHREYEVPIDYDDEVVFTVVNTSDEDDVIYNSAADTSYKLTLKGTTQYEIKYSKVPDGYKTDAQSIGVNQNGQLFYNNVEEIESMDLTPYDEIGIEPNAETYTIVCEETKNGSIEANKEQAEYKDSVKITVDPDEGYELDSLTYSNNDDSTYEATEINQDSEGYYAFEMPAYNVTIHATFAATSTGGDTTTHSHAICGTTCTDAVCGAKHDLDTGCSLENVSWTALSSVLTEADDGTWSGELDNAGNYYLDQNFTLSETLNISADVNLCLNGKTLSLSSDATSGSVIKATADLTLCDCSVDESGTITGGKGDASTQPRGGGVYSTGSLYIYGGNITGNEAYYGCGVYVTGREVIMYGGEITGNKNVYSIYGGIYTDSSTTVKIYNAKVADNTYTDTYGSGDCGDLVVGSKTNLYVSGNSVVDVIFVAAQAGGYVNFVPPSEAPDSPTEIRFVSNVGPKVQNGVINDQYYINWIGEKPNDISDYFTFACSIDGNSADAYKLVSKAGDDGNTLYGLSLYSITVPETLPTGISAITPDPIGAKSGTTIKVTATAADGYEVTSVTAAYTDADGNEQTTGASLSNGTWNFTMPAADVTLTATANAVVTHENHPLCGTSCSHTGEDTHEDITWTGVSTEDELRSAINAVAANTTTTDGYYYLTDDIELEAALELPEQAEDVDGVYSFNLCLNGKVLSMSSEVNDTIFKSDSKNYYGAVLSITDCDNSTEHKFEEDENGLWTLDESGDKTLTGGVITGGRGYDFYDSRRGGVVYINYGAYKVNLYGGNLVGNSADNGGAVYLNYSTSEFNMYGGAIVGNTAEDGGGVYVYAGTFNLYDGEITENTATDEGGGVCGNYTPLHIYGGSVNGNTCSKGDISFAGGNSNGLHLHTPDYDIGNTLYSMYGTITLYDDVVLKETLNVYVSSIPTTIVQGSFDATKIISMDDYKVRSDADNDCVIIEGYSVPFRAVSTLDDTIGVDGSFIIYEKTEYESEAERIQTYDQVNTDPDDGGVTTIGKLKKDRTYVVTSQNQRWSGYKYLGVSGNRSTYALGTFVLNDKGELVSAADIYENDEAHFSMESTVESTGIVVKFVPDLYSITISEHEGGSISVEKTEGLTYGTEVVVTVEPDEGYELGQYDLTYTADNGFWPQYIYKNNGVYSFTMPADNVTLKANFKKITRDIGFIICNYDGYELSGYDFTLTCESDNTITEQPLTSTDEYDGWDGEEYPVKAKGLCAGTWKVTISKNELRDYHKHSSDIEVVFEIEDDGTVKLSENHTITNATAELDGTTLTIKLMKKESITVDVPDTLTGSYGDGLYSEENPDGILLTANAYYTDTDTKFDMLPGFPIKITTTYTQTSPMGEYTVTVEAADETLAQDYNVTFLGGKLTISEKVLDADDFVVTVSDKNYNGTTDADATVAFAEGALVGDDELTFTYTAAFNSAEAGADKPVTITITGISGDAVGSYKLPEGGLVIQAEADIFPVLSDDDGDGVYDDGNDNYYIPDQDGDGNPEPESDTESGIFEGTDSEDDKTYVIDPDRTNEDDANKDDIYVEVDDTDGDGIYEEVTEGDTEGDRYIPDQNGDHIAEKETDNDGIFEDDEGNNYIVDEDGSVKDVIDNGNGTYTDPGDDGQVGTDDDGYTYIPDQDGDGKAEPDSDGDGDYDGTKDTDDDSTNDPDTEYVPVDKNGDGVADTYVDSDEVIDGVYTDPETGKEYKDNDDDGILDPKVPVDTDGDGDADIYVDPDEVIDGVYTDPETGKEYEDNDDDGILDPKVPVDTDGDGDADIYVDPDEVIDGTYTDEDGNQYTDQDGDGILDPKPATPDLPDYPIIVPTYYDITVNSAVNGDVSANRKTAASGTTITLTVDPDNGYELNTLTVTDKYGNAITVTEKANGTYTFRMPAKDVWVTATFTKTSTGSDVDDTCPRDYTCPMYSYSDVNMQLWYHDGIHYCIEHGLMGSTSTSELTFEPETTTNRAMIVTILWRLEGKPTVNYAMTFEDVADGMWYTEAVRWAQANGIVEGYSDEQFGPADIITREQLATILYRYEKMNGGGFTGVWMYRMDYVDLEDVSDWAYEAMCWMNMKGIVTGKPGKLLDPKGSATRAEAATMLQRYCELKEEND